MTSRAFPRTDLANFLQVDFWGATVDPVLSARITNSVRRAEPTES
jgi:hypothetical protein